MLLGGRGAPPRGGGKSINHSKRIANAHTFPQDAVVGVEDRWFVDEAAGGGHESCTVYLPVMLTAHYYCDAMSEVMFIVSNIST